MNNKLNAFMIFVVLVFVLSIPFWVLNAIRPILILPGLPLSALAAFTPAIAALILIYKSERFEGARRLLSRAFDFKRVKQPAWYLVVVLVNPLIAGLAYGWLRATGESIPEGFSLSVAIVPMFIVFFIAALGEEIGWSGYATELLRARWGLAMTGLSLGIVWAAWHFISLLQVPRSLDWIAWWSLGTVSLRVIMVWIFDHTGGSVFAVTVFHAMINVCWQLFPVNGSYYDPKVFGLISFGLAVLVMVLPMANRLTFSIPVNQ